METTSRMAKRKAGALDALSPNEPSPGARRSSRRTPVSDWFEGKENGNHRGSNTPVKSALKNSDIRAPEVSSRKQSRLGDDAGRNAGPPAARKRIQRSPEEHGLPGSGNSTLSKGNVSAERPRGAQLPNVVLGDGNCTGTPLRDQNDAAGPACGHSRCPDSLHCGLINGRRTKARTSKAALPTGPVSGKKDVAKGSRNLDRSGVEHVEVRDESTREGDGSSENEVEQERKGNVADNPATTIGNECAVLSVKPDSGCKGQGVIDHSGNKNRCLDDGSVELTAAGHHSSCLEESIGKKAQVPLENASQYKSRISGTSSETEKMNDRVSVERERTHGVTTGALQGSERRCPSRSGVGRSFVGGEAAQVLQEAYNKLYKKYQRSKMRKLTDVEALYDEQTRRFAAFSTAADALVGKLREENNFLTRQLEHTNVQECIKRSMLLEEELIECRNDFVMERCKVLELEQELRESQICIMELKTSCSTIGPNSTSVVPEQQSCGLEATQDVKLRTENAVQPQSFDMETLRSSGSPSPLIGGKDEIMKNTLPAVDSTEKESSAEGALQRAQGTDIEVCARQSESGQLKTGPGVRKLLHALLQNLTQMTPVVDGDSSHIMFIHEESGFTFRLVQNEHSQAVGGDDALLYQVMEPGTLLHLVPEWMKSEFVFDITQTNVLFQRILTLAFGCRLN